MVRCTQFSSSLAARRRDAFEVCPRSIGTARVGRPIGLQCRLGLGKVGGVLDDLAVAQHDRALGIAGDVLVVRDQDHRDLLSLVQLSKQRDHFATGLGVQVTGGFIPHQNRGAIDECPGDGDTLLLTARKLARVMMIAITQSDLIQHFTCPIATLAR